MIARLRSVQERQLYLVRRYLPRLGDEEVHLSELRDANRR